VHAEIPILLHRVLGNPHIKSQKTSQNATHNAKANHPPLEFSKKFNKTEGSKPIYTVSNYRARIKGTMNF